MNVEEHAWHSPAIGREMRLRLYGNDGRPIVAFPPHAGRFSDFEGFGMVDSVAHLVEGGRIRIVAVDSIGTDVNHDWPWWRRMLPHELERMGV